MFTRRWGLKPDLTIRAVLLTIFLALFILMGMLNPNRAAAKTEFSDPADKLTVVLNDNGVAFELATYTISELEKMPQVQREYSSIDRMPAPVFTAGKGIDLESFLSGHGIDISSISHCRFYATDDLVKKLDRNMLFDRTGYYFPQIVACWDTDWDEETNRYTDVEKVSAGAAPVKTMLAITSSQGRWLDSPDWGNLDGSTCLRLCLGQVSPDECITMNFVRWVYKIEVFGKLRTGGSSSFAPRTTLDKPLEGAGYRPGDKVEVRGTVERLSSLSLAVTDPDGHAIYTAFDVEVEDGGFTDEFTLADDAVPGDYTIEAGPTPGSNLGCKKIIRVTAAPASAARITLNTPQSGHIFKPLEKIVISGTARGLYNADLKVVGPGGQNVYTGVIDKSGEFSKEFTLNKDALPGEYGIQISATGLERDYTRVFTVAKSPSQPAVEPATPPRSSLADIDNHWARERIDKLVARGAISGYPDGTFKPEATISRAEFTAVVVKTFNLNVTDGQIPGDMAGHWARPYIATAIAAGIVGDYDSSRFAPDDPITREQMAFMVAKAANLPVAAGPSTFSDSGSIAAWAREAVAAAVQSQVIRGYPDNSFKPHGNASRGEAATVIVNAVEL